ncbi:MAG: hypothetical protein AB1679_07905 [Actinomycetota bacterium]
MRLGMKALLAMAGLMSGAGCDHEPDIVLTTVLSLRMPAAENENLMRSMCDLPTQRPNDALRVRWTNGQRVVFEQTVRCEPLRENPGPQTERP